MKKYNIIFYNGAIVLHLKVKDQAYIINIKKALLEVFDQNDILRKNYIDKHF